MSSGDGLIGGRFRTIRRLGAGGMGSVVLAEDEILGRLVAIKRLHPGSGPELLQRFRQEMRIAASLSHPNVVGLLDAIVEDGDVLLIMEYVDGETLSARLKRGPVDAGEALRITTALGEAVDAIHARGILHRDIKPANILLGVDGSVKLADLGLARAVDKTGLTTTSSVVGTPAYLAPELFADQPPSPASDIWALAAVASEMLTGRRARPGVTPAAVAMAASREVDVDVRERFGAAPALEAALRRGLALDPARRPHSARGLVAELAEGIRRAAPGAPDEPTRAIRVADGGRAGGRRAAAGAAGAAGAGAAGAAPAGATGAGRTADEAGAAGAPARRAERARLTPDAPPSGRAPAASVPARDRRATGARDVAPPPRRRRLLPVALAAALLAGLLVAFLALRGGGDDDAGRRAATQPAADGRTGTSADTSSSDSAGTDTGTTSQGTGTAGQDTGTSSQDSSAGGQDTGTTGQDSGAGGEDTGTTGQDTGTGGSTSTSGASSSGSATTAGPRSPAGAVRAFYTRAAADRFEQAWAVAGPGLRSQLGGFGAFRSQFADVQSIDFGSLSARGTTVSFRTTARHSSFVDRCSGTARTSKGTSGGYVVEGIAVRCTRSQT